MKASIERAWAAWQLNGWTDREIARVAPLVDLMRRVQQQQPRRIDLDRRVGEQLLDQLLLTDRLAELAALARVFGGHVEDARRLADGAGADLREADAAERLEGVIEAAAFLPEQVLGPPRPGRKLVLTGDTAPAAAVVEAATGADVLVHEATFLADERERARETSHSTAGEPALVARNATIRALLLFGTSDHVIYPDFDRMAAVVFPDHIGPRRLEACGHFVPWEAPDALVAGLVDLCSDLL